MTGDKEEGHYSIPGDPFPLPVNYSKGHERTG